MFFYCGWRVKNRQQVPTILIQFSLPAVEVCISVLGFNYITVWEGKTFPASFHARKKFKQDKREILHNLVRFRLFFSSFWRPSFYTYIKCLMQFWIIFPPALVKIEMATAIVRSWLFTAVSSTKSISSTSVSLLRDIIANCEEKAKGTAWQTGFRFWNVFRLGQLTFVSATVNCWCFH